MIPATNSKLLVAEDWTKIYQSFNNADFKSYDYDTLRRIAVQYLRANYPEDFNDYIESSEFIALVDIIAYLGQNLSFRIDLNARENFLETAQRRDSILNLARLISYNPRRNTPASGLLKITAISTTDNIIDSNNINLANQIVSWDDPSNNNWYQQWILIMNSAMPGSTNFGKPYASETISGILTDSYKINSSQTNAPLFSFNKSINGIPMGFEIVSSTFVGKNYIYEEAPAPGNPMGIVWRNDNKGAGSANTGFFMHFKQGALGQSTFAIDNPVPNEIVGINATDINDTDVWLWQLNPDGSYSKLWSKVESTAGNNVIYNSLSLDTRTLYAVSTRINDQIDLNFTDGNFGDLPKGLFVLYYRQSNGLSYNISPSDINGLSISIPYINKAGQNQSLSITLSLQSTVYNSAPAETDTSIKQNAPKNYYIQNRMITGEDYNIAPVTVAADILKVKSINRQSSGISKYFDLTDVTGKYSQVDIFAQDGMIYKQDSQLSFTATFETRNQAFGILKSQVEPIVAAASTRNFYLNKFPRPDLLNINLGWKLAQTESGQVKGYFQNLYDFTPQQVGYFSSNNAQYITPGALIKFNPPSGYYYLPSGKLTQQADSSTRTYIWTRVSSVSGDGSNSGLGLLNDGTGPITLTGFIADGSVAVEIIPALVTSLPFSLETEIVNQMVTRINFGLSFDRLTRTWFVVTDTNIDLIKQFNLIYQGDTSNQNIDASWQIAFQWMGTYYNIFYRKTDYVFESMEQTAFLVDDYKNNFDYVSNTTIKDKISVLGINTIPNLGNTWRSSSATPQVSLGVNGDFYLNTADPENNIVYRKINGLWIPIPAGQTINELGKDHDWQIDSGVIESDGYVEPKKVLISFYDSKNDGQIDDPDSFEIITDSKNPLVQTGYLGNFIYFEYSADRSRYTLVDASQFVAYPDESYVDYTPLDGQKFYFYSNDVIKMYNAPNLDYILQPQYFARSGRSGLKFHYVHNSGEEKRIDPAKSNIIDIYMLTTAYDTAFRMWLKDTTQMEPQPPSTATLEETYSQYLEPIKSISDTIIYHPASYKILFGQSADLGLQATFRAVKNNTLPVSDNNLKTRIIQAIDEFFALEHWDFGDSFNFSELSTYIMNKMTPDITNFIIVAKNGATFGNLFEVSCQSSEIFVSGAQVSDIEIISSITPSQLTIS
jgi:hypothetical protein